MATIHITAAPEATHTTNPKKALADDAMGELCKFINIAKENPHALDAWNEYLTQERPVIEITDVDGQPVFFLSKPLAAFLHEEVAA